ncbi:uncharacterized protein BKA78DRAFT_44285 [Phyllosticta capitalensis]|uniref:uncharacterized protein n=1 Tax=Phyllosticta capitalensis TaxID=121624 RepID=UPI00312EB799
MARTVGCFLPFWPSCFCYSRFLRRPAGWLAGWLAGWSGCGVERAECSVRLFVYIPRYPEVSRSRRRGSDFWVEFSQLRLCMSRDGSASVQWLIYQSLPGPHRSITHTLTLRHGVSHAILTCSSSTRRGRSEAPCTSVTRHLRRRHATTPFPNQTLSITSPPPFASFSVFPSDGLSHFHLRDFCFCTPCVVFHCPLPTTATTSQKSKKNMSPKKARRKTQRQRQTTPDARRQTPEKCRHLHHPPYLLHHRHHPTTPQPSHAPRRTAPASLLPKHACFAHGISGLRA